MNPCDNDLRPRFPLGRPASLLREDHRNPLLEPIVLPLGAVRLLPSLTEGPLQDLRADRVSEADSDCFLSPDEVPHRAVGEMSAALRAYFPVPTRLSQLQRVRWEQAVTGVVSALAPALVREQMTPAELRALIESLRRMPRDVESAFSVEGYIASGVGYLVGQVCYWLGLPAGASIAAGMMMPNVAMAAWRSLYVLAWEYSQSLQASPEDDQARFFADHFRSQNQSFLQEATRVFQANVAGGWEMVNLNKRDALKVLLAQMLPADQRPVTALPDYAAEHPNALTISFLSTPADRIVAMIRSGDFRIDVTRDRSNLDLLWTLMDPAFYRRRLLPHGCAQLTGMLMADALNTVFEVARPVTGCVLKKDVRPGSQGSVHCV